MASKPYAQLIADKHVYEIRQNNAKGGNDLKDTYSELEALSTEDSLKIFAGYVGKRFDQRRAAMSTLTDVLRLSYEKLTFAKGTGNVKKGKLSAALSEEFLKAEDTFFGQFMEADNPKHGWFLKNVLGGIKFDAKGDDLDGGDKPNYRERFTQFVRETRREPSYANAKNLFLNYWHFVGQDPYHEDPETGKLYLMPPEAMGTEVRRILDVPKVDNSWQTRLDLLLKEFMVPEGGKGIEEGIMVDFRVIPELLTHLRIVTNELERRLRVHQATVQKLAKEAEERKTASETKTDVVEQAKALMDATLAKKEANAGPGDEGGALAKSKA